MLEKKDLEMVAKAIYDNLLWENMEAYIAKEDGDTFVGFRQVGSLGENENEIIATVDLSEWQWREVLDEYGLNGEETDAVDAKEAFIKDVVYEEIDMAIRNRDVK